MSENIPAHLHEQSWMKIQMEISVVWFLSSNISPVFMGQLLSLLRCVVTTAEGRITPWTCSTQSVRRRVLQFRGLYYYLIVTISCQVYSPAVRLVIMWLTDLSRNWLAAQGRDELLLCGHVTISTISRFPECFKSHKTDHLMFRVQSSYLWYV